MHNDLLERQLKEYKERNNSIGELSNYNLEDLKADAIKFNCVENLVKYKCRDENCTVCFSYNRLNSFRTRLIIIQSNLLSHEDSHIKFSNRTISIDAIIDYIRYVSESIYKEPCPFKFSEV